MSTTTKMSTSIYIADASEAKRIQRAAKKQGLSVSAFMREASLKEAARLHEQCPTCGRKHAA